MSAERFHHPYSPSQLQALEYCPSYEGRQGFSEAAETGTKQHTVAETGEDDGTLSDEQIQAAAAAMDFLKAKKEVLEKEGDIISWLEPFLPIDDEHTTAGYADAIIISADRKKAVLVDYKFGQWEVEKASNNRQSDAYALGVFHAFPSVETVQVFFFQPSVANSNTITWSRKDVPELLLRIKVIVEKAKVARKLGDFSSARASVPVCLFCKHLALCPVVTEKVIRVAKKFHAIEVPDEITPSMVHDARNATLGMRLASLVTTWASAFKSLTSDRVLRGDAPIPEGYEITKGRGRRKIEDAAKFREVALRYLTPEQYADTVEPQLGKVESAISNTAVRGQKTQTLEEFKELLVTTEAVKLGEAYPYLKAKTKSE